MTDALHIRGRWVTMTTASRCVHHVSLADSCAPCGETGLLSEFSDALLLAECDRRRLFMPVAAEPAPAVVVTPVALDASDLVVPVLEKPTPPERPAKKGRK